MEAPLYPQALLGYREWQVLNGRLCSIGLGCLVWEPGLISAECRSCCSSDQVPNPACECGLYAWHSPTRVEASFDVRRLSNGRAPVVSGVVIGGGRSAIHYEGFRAERMQVAALLRPRRADRATQKLLVELSQYYQVPVVRSVRALKKCGAKLASPAPSGLLPEPAPGPPRYYLQPTKPEPLELWLGGIALVALISFLFSALVPALSGYQETLATVGAFGFFALMFCGLRRYSLSILSSIQIISFGWLIGFFSAFLFV